MSRFYYTDKDQITPDRTPRLNLALKAIKWWWMAHQIKYMAFNRGGSPGKIQTRRGGPLKNTRLSNFPHPLPDKLVVPKFVVFLQLVGMHKHCTDSFLIMTKIMEGITRYLVGQQQLYLEG